MKLCHPCRLLLPVSGTLLIIPFVFPEELGNGIILSIFYFLGICFFLLNFPRLSEFMNEKPIYIEDLVLANEGENSHRFKNIYINIMIIVLSLLCALFAQYVTTKGLYEKPLVEILGIIGGNLILYVKIQHVVGRVLINLCHCVKEQHEMTSISRSGSFIDSFGSGLNSIHSFRPKSVSPDIIETNIDDVFGISRH